MHSIFMQGNLYNHILLIHPRYVLLGWDIVHSFVAERKSDSSFFYNSTPHTFLHHSICYTQWGLWRTLRDNLHFISQSDFLQTLLLMWTLQLSDGIYYLGKHVILNVWVTVLYFIQLSYCGNLPQRSFTRSASLRESCRLAIQRGA
jgi:hypothetical protein